MQCIGELQPGFSRPELEALLYDESPGIGAITIGRHPPLPAKGQPHVATFSRAALADLPPVLSIGKIPRLGVVPQPELFQGHLSGEHVVDEASPPLAIVDQLLVQVRGFDPYHGPMDILKPLLPAGDHNITSFTRFAESLVIPFPITA